MSKDKKIAGMSHRRVYSYVSEDGIVFWSLTKTDATVSSGKRLILQSRRGVPLIPFMVYLREQAAEEDSAENNSQLVDNT